MKEKFKTISILLLGLLLFGLVGCGSDKTADKKNPPTNQEYYDYLTERYNYYFNNSDLDTNYDVFLDNFTYDGSYDEFITVYNDDYGQLKRNLEAFKSDLENNVILVKGNVPGPKKSLVMIRTSVKKGEKVNETEELISYVEVTETPVEAASEVASTEVTEENQIEVNE